MKGLDFKKMVAKIPGRAVGLVVAKQVNNIGFVQKQKPMIQGLLMIALGDVLVPMVAGKAKKASGIVSDAGDTIATLGTAKLISSFAPSMVPTIAGYEDYPIAGPSYEVEEEVSGADDEDNDPLQ